MADIDHKDIVDPEVHEPKDISSATSGEVYTANGAGGGDWSNIPSNQPSNTVIINDLSDFPVPVADVITLASNTLYFVGPIVNIGVNRLVFSTNTVIEGNNRSISAISSTTTGSLITATGVECRVSNITLLSTTAPKLIEFDGSALRTLRVTDVVAFGHTGVAIQSTSAVACVVTLSQFVGGTDGLVLVGANNTSLLVGTSAFVDFSGIAVDFGSSIWQNCTISDSLFSGDAGSFSISGLTNSGNVAAGRRCNVFNSLFNGLGTPLQNITSQDLLFLFEENTIVPDSVVVGQIFLSGSALTTTLGVDTPTKINATTWATERDDRFTINANGRLTYIGEEDIEAGVSLAITGSGSSGSNEFNLYIAKNGTEITASKSRATFPSTSDTGLTTFTLISLVKNDFIEAFIESGGTDFVCKDANMGTRG